MLAVWEGYLEERLLCFIYCFWLATWSLEHGLETGRSVRIWRYGFNISYGFGDVMDLLV